MENPWRAQYGEHTHPPLNYHDEGVSGCLLCEHLWEVDGG